LRYKEELAEQETRLGNALARIYGSIKRDLSLELRAGRLTFSDIQRIYRKRTDDIIRSSVEEMYRLAAKKTAERDLKIPFFQTATDRSATNQLIQRYQNWYWVGLSRELVNKTAMAYDPRTLMQLKMSDIRLKETFLDRMVGSIVAEVTGVAVVSKGQQVLQGNFSAPKKLPRVYRQAQVESGPHFVWKTSDDTDVCQICAGLDGSEYAIDDPNIPTPIADSHPSCRCELQLIDAEFSGQELYEDIEDLEGIEI